MTTSLPNAIRTAIAHGNSIHDGELNLQRWSETYGNCGVEYIRIVWEGIQSEMSRQPQDTFDHFGEGK